MTDAHSWGRGVSTRVATRDFPASVLALVDERQGGRFCVTCRAHGITTPDGEPLEIDHMQPLSKGGDNHHRNLRWLCRAHNRGRGARRDAPDVPRSATARGKAARAARKARGS